jgi:hypothetical protein
MHKSAIAAVTLSCLLVNCGSSPGEDSGSATVDSLDQIEAQASEGAPTAVETLPFDEAPASLQAATVVDRLYRGDYLFQGQQLMDTRCHYHLDMQSDGNAVTYNPWGDVWSTGTSWAGPGSYMRFQWDSNLVIYNQFDQDVWATNTVGRSASSVVQQTDGNLVMYRGTTPVWSSGYISRNLTDRCGGATQAGVKTYVASGNLPGSDLPNPPWSPRPSDCGTQCAANPACLAWTWYNQVCWMKNTAAINFVALQGATSGKKMFANL